MIRLAKRTQLVTPKRLVVAVLVVACVLLGVGFRDAIYRQLDAWMLIPRPERLTELYFTDHKALPSTYRAGESHVLDFTVHNIEYRTTTYHWRITQESEDGKQTAEIAKGDITLGQEDLRIVSNRIEYQDMGVRVRVRVTLSYQGIKWGEDSLSDQQQSIHYWVKNLQVSRTTASSAAVLAQRMPDTLCSGSSPIPCIASKSEASPAAVISINLTSLFPISYFPFPSPSPPFPNSQFPFPVPSPPIPISHFPIPIAFAGAAYA